MSDCVVSFTLTVQSQIALIGRPFTNDERQQMAEAGEHLTGYGPFPSLLQDTCKKYLDVAPNKVISSENKPNKYGGWDVRNADGLEGYFAWLRENLKARTAEDEYDSEWIEFYNDHGEFAETYGYADLHRFQYYQTHGGGPEGGFLYFDDGNDQCLFAVERNWGTPWTFTYIPNTLLEVGVSDNVPSIRLLPNQGR